MKLRIVLYFYPTTMNFVFTTAMDRNGQKSGIIREGAINELGEVSYTKHEEFDETNYPSFEEIVANEVLKRVYGVERKPVKQEMVDKAFDAARREYNIKTPTTNEETKPPKETPTEKPVTDEVKVGVNIKALSDDEFIEFTNRRVRMNREFDRFKAIKAKIRASLEGRMYNEKAFNMFVKLHEIEKRGFFNRTKEDMALIEEAIKLYGTA